MTFENVQNIQVRYNTLSDGEHLCWRLILDGTEHLVNSINVQVPCFTSRDWLEEKGEFKHHISMCNCTVQVDEQGNATVLPATITA